jgi:EmrB/QacA subfamily drug resistance transporter
MSATAAPPSTPGRSDQLPAGRPHRAILPVVLAATFMSALDFFVVNVAIPAIQRDLRASATAIEWVVAGYGLAFGAGLITAGRLGDLYGRRRIFSLGLALFTLASAACGLAPNGAVLVGARVVQGLAAALLSPQVLAIIRTTFSGTRLARAFSTYALTLGVAAVFGQLAGGLLIRADLFGLGWRTCFLINIPIGLAALVLTPRVIPETRSPARVRLDLSGTVLVTAALVALILPLIEGRAQGWPLWTWLSLAGSALLFAAFGVSQRSRSAPLIDLSLFAHRAFTAGLLAQLVFWLGQASFFLVLALYLQQGRGLSALAAGVVFSALGAGYLLTSTTAHRFTARLGRQTLALGGLTMAIGLTALELTVRHLGGTDSVALLVPALVVDGIGMGLAVAPLVNTVLSRVDPHQAGAAGGVLATAQQVGNALGVAVIGIVFYSGHAPAPAAFAHSLTYLIAVELALVGFVQLLPRTAGARAVSPAK